MKSSRLVATAVVVVSCALGATAAAQDTIYAGGGSPTDAYSCYSDCGGASPKTGTAHCYCDDACLARGNCCADRDEFCTPALTAANVPVAQPACSLTSNSKFANFCGTDLGFVYPLSNQYEVLFGDSWTWLSGGWCDDRAGAPNYNGFQYDDNDDSQGTLPITRPASVPTTAASINTSTVQDCTPTLLSLDKSGNDFTPVTLHDELDDNKILKLPPGQTPLAGFGDGTNAWVVFKQGPSGFSDPNAPFTMYLAYRESPGRNNYRVRENLSGIASTFLNASAAKVTTINDNVPNLSNWTVPSSGGTLLLFGRPSFYATTGPAPGLYLLRQPLPLTTPPLAKSWFPQYYAGRDAIGRPTWSSSSAVSILDGDFKISNQIDIKFIPSINKWVMLYGGDVTATDDANRPNDQPRHGAIHMRMADYPWGPWTRATPLLRRESMRGYYECDAPFPAGCDTSPYTPGTWQSNLSSTVPGCVPDSSALQPVEPNPFGCGFNQRGIMYAPEMLVTWTNSGAYNATARYKTDTLYFLVSTWMPYQVVLAAADLHTTSQTYARGVSVQLRDYQNRMIKNGDPTNQSSRAGGNLGGATAWKVGLADGSAPGRGPAIGDAVVFRSSADNGAYYLSRTGDFLRFDATATTTLSTRQKWILESTNTTTYPNGTPIVLGKTPFYIKQYDVDRHIKSKGTDGWRNLVGTPAQDATFTMTWGCIQESGSTETCLQ